MTYLESQQSLLSAARECAELAGSVAFSHYRTNVAVEWKGDGSPVTVADRGAEEAVREWIRSRFSRGRRRARRGILANTRERADVAG